MDCLSNKVILSHIQRRIDQNQNALILCVGPTGSGKSYGAMRLLEKKCDNFKDVDYIEFHPLKLFKLLDVEMPPGSGILADEVGVSMGVREWNSVQNKVMGKLFQTNRYRNQIIIFTVPNISFVDIQLRKLMHYLMETKKIDYEKKIAYYTFRRIVSKHNHKKHKDMTLYKSIPYKDKDGRLRQTATLKLKMPSMAEQYEYKKKLELEAINSVNLENLEKFFGFNKRKGAFHG